MSESTRMLLGLALGIIIMIVLVMKTKVHSFMALLIAAMITGIIGGMPISDITLADGTTQTGLITAIQEGFGSTLKSTGIIIGLGVMMGGILEKSGAAEKMAYSFIKLIGQKNEEWALAITGWFISIPVFADSAIVIFAPLCKAMSKVTGKSVVGLALSLAVVTVLAGCGGKNSGGNIDNVQIPDWKPSEIYSDSDIEAAFQTVKDYFGNEFDGCTLTKLSYPGDTYADDFYEWAEQYDADEAIVILSSFDVDSSDGDGSLNPDSTYDDWKWILIRNDSGNWEHVDHGY